MFEKLKSIKYTQGPDTHENIITAKERNKKKETRRKKEEERKKKKRKEKGRGNKGKEKA